MTTWATLLAAIIVGTWNGNWFPSHRAEHRDTPEKEALTIQAAGNMLAAALRELDPLGTNDVVLSFNEMRNKDVAQRLTAAIGRTNLVVASVSEYRRRDRFDMQQDVIATTLPIVWASWSKWHRAKAETPPRGYAQAELLFAPSITGRVYSVHLKSNYGQRTAADIALNRAKRTRAVNDLIQFTKSYKAPVLILGDMNADKWKKEFVAEELFSNLEKAGYCNELEALPEDGRATYVGRGKGRGSALDYIFTRHFTRQGLPRIFSAQGYSDHDSLFVVLDVDKKSILGSSR